MIIYSKTLWGLPLLSRAYGSALSRALVPAVAAGLLALALSLCGNARLAGLWTHPYAYMPVVLIVTFVLTFRSNYAYQRHWEAYTHARTMASRWVDAAMQIALFDRHPHPGGSSGGGGGARGAAAAALATSHNEFIVELVHLISLLHALSCQALRRDPDLRNLLPHNTMLEAPPSDPAQLKSTASGAAPGGGAAAAPPGGAAGAQHTAPGDGAGAAGAPPTTGGGSSSSLAPPGWAGLAAYMATGANIIGAANWRDLLLLRGSRSAIAKYNAAQPLSVIGGVSPAELAGLGCSLASLRRHSSSSSRRAKRAALCAPDGRRQQHQQQHPQPLLPHVHSASCLNMHRRSSSPEQWLSAAAAAAATAAMAPDADGCSDAEQADDTEHPADATAFACAPVSPHMQAQPLPTGTVQRRWWPVRLSPPSPKGVARHGGGGGGLDTHAAAWAGFDGRGTALRRGRSLTRHRVSLNAACCSSHVAFMDRPLVVMAWLHELLLVRQSQGGLSMPAPILARVYTLLSEGLAAFEQLKKIADTPFPFPWAQFVLVMLLLFSATLPLLVLAFVPSTALAVVLSAITVGTCWAVNEVARDVEDPFLYEPNEMPLANGQYHVNELLLTLAATQRPPSNLACSSGGALTRTWRPHAQRHPHGQQHVHAPRRSEAAGAAAAAAAAGPWPASSGADAPHACSAGAAPAAGGSAAAAPPGLQQPQAAGAVAVSGSECQLGWGSGAAGGGNAAPGLAVTAPTVVVHACGSSALGA